MISVLESLYIKLPLSLKLVIILSIFPLLKPFLTDLKAAIVLVTISSITIFFNQQKKILRAIALASLISWTSIEYNLNFSYNKYPSCINGVSILIATFVVITILKISKKSRFFFLIYFSILFFLMATTPFIHQKAINQIFSSILDYLTFICWYVILLQVDNRNRDINLNIDLIWYVIPLWSFSKMAYQPTSNGPSFLIDRNTRDIKSFYSTQFKGIKLLLFTCILNYCLNFYSFLIFGWNFNLETKKFFSFNYPSLSYGFDIIYRSYLQISLFERWIVFLSHVFLTYGQMGVQFGISISIARLLGFKLPRMMFSPWKARSFNDFFYRILYYYNLILMTVFFPFFKFFFRFIKNKRLRITFSIFSSIFFGGILFHYFRDLDLYYWRFGFFTSIVRYSNAIPYFLFIAVYASFFVLSRQVVRSRPFSMQLLTSFVYFVVFSVIYSLNMAGTHNYTDWKDYFYFLKLLFGLN